MSELALRPEPVEVLLFDLGGVVLDIDLRRCFAHWAHCADGDVEELAARFSIDAAYEAHERGALPISGSGMSPSSTMRSLPAASMLSPPVSWRRRRPPAAG